MPIIIGFWVVVIAILVVFGGKRLRLPRWLIIFGWLAIALASAFMLIAFIADPFTDNSIFILASLALCLFSIVMAKVSSKVSEDSPEEN